MPTSDSPSLSPPQRKAKEAPAGRATRATREARAPLPQHHRGRPQQGPISRPPLLPLASARLTPLPTSPTRTPLPSGWQRSAASTVVRMGSPPASTRTTEPVSAPTSAVMGSPGRTQAAFPSRSCKPTLAWPQAPWHPPTPSPATSVVWTPTTTLTYRRSRACHLQLQQVARPSAVPCWWRWACRLQPQQLEKPSAAPCSWTWPCLPQSLGWATLSSWL